MFLYFSFLIISKIIISFEICEAGKNFCSKCNPISKLCEKCEKNIFIPDNNGGCISSKKCILGRNHCLECEEDSNLCKICEDRYYPDEIGGCSYANDCQISYEGECLKCKEGLVLIGSDIKICKSLNSEDLKNCANINMINGLCDKCQEGFYLNTGDKKCIDVENCDKSSFGICIKCSLNYYLDKKDDKCKEQKGPLKNCKQTLDGVNCDSCDEDYYFDEEGICIDINYCSKEGPYVKCEKCIEGYYPTVYGDSCTKEKNCYLGNKDIGICYQCESEYYIDFKDGKCKPNREDNDFKYCRKADNDCYNCIYGTYLGKDKKCSLSRFCSESDLGKCIECIEDYHLGLDNICTNVDKCIYTDFYGICTECENNYYYNRTSKLCELEKKNFEYCKITNLEGTFCDKCKNDFYINKTDHLCYNNKEKNDFYKCISTNDNGEYCLICEEGYFNGYIDHKCSTIEGCDISENENICIKCNSDYYCFDDKNKKCEYNDEIISEEKKFYFRCNLTNNEGNECQQCLDGYELKDGLCMEDNHCEEKDDVGNCLKCITYDEDFYFYCLNSNFGCVESYNDGCLICNNLFDFDNCTKCMESFELNDKNECIAINEK